MIKILDYLLAMVAIQQLERCRCDDAHENLRKKFEIEHAESILLNAMEHTAIGAGQTHRRRWWLVLFARHFHYHF